MLEGIWYALLVAVQALVINPANHNSTFVAEVYIDAKRTYTFELKGSMTDGVFYDQLSKKNLGSFEESRKSSRSYLIDPAMGIEEKASETSSSTPSPKNEKASAKSTEAPEVPPPFIVDLSPVTSTMKDFGKNPFQNFKALVIDKKDKASKSGETKKTDADKKEKASEISVLKNGDQFIISDPQNGIMVIVRIET